MLNHNNHHSLLWFDFPFQLQSHIFILTLLHLANQPSSTRTSIQTSCQRNLNLRINAAHVVVPSFSSLCGIKGKKDLISFTYTFLWLVPVIAGVLVSHLWRWGRWSIQLVPGGSLQWRCSLPCPWGPREGLTWSKPRKCWRCNSWY